MSNFELLQQELVKSYCDRSWLRLAGISREDIRNFRPVFYDAASMLLELTDDRGRIRAEDILVVWKKTAGKCFFDVDEDEPDEGWLMNTYLYLRSVLFPHLEAPHTNERITVSRICLLRFLRGVYEYERKNCPFDPRRDMLILSDSEIDENGFTREYLRMKRVIRDNYIYEFMRIGAEITSFNTLGHVSGVHYVAMYIACQKLVKTHKLQKNPIKDQVVAISCGIVAGNPILDLDYLEDSNAEVDANFIMSGNAIIEIQACGEKRPFTEKEYDILLKYALKSRDILINKQKKALNIND